MFQSSTSNNKQKKAPQSAAAILFSNDFLVQRDKSAKYVTTEHQDYGLRLAHRLQDTDRISFYIKLAKEEYRPVLESALSFADDYHNVRNKASVFLWKLKQLRNERKEREEKQKEKQSKMF